MSHTETNKTKSDTTSKTQIGTLDPKSGLHYISFLNGNVMTVMQTRLLGIEGCSA